MTPSPKRAVRPAEAAAKLGISMSGLWRKVRNDPTFPQARKVSQRCTFFIEDELDAYLASSDRLAKPANQAA